MISARVRTDDVFVCNVATLKEKTDVADCYVLRSRSAVLRRNSIRVAGRSA